MLKRLHPRDGIESAIAELPGHLPVGDLGGSEWLLQEIRGRGDLMREQKRRAEEYLSASDPVRRG